jgi:hypothetical protein
MKINRTRKKNPATRVSPLQLEGALFQQYVLTVVLVVVAFSPPWGLIAGIALVGGLADRGFFLCCLPMAVARAQTGKSGYMYQKKIKGLRR